jgi:hypothetical protein
MPSYVPAGTPSFHAVGRATRQLAMEPAAVPVEARISETPFISTSTPGRS